jgi:uncharacterized protein YndB with AHSA1/START domain
MSSDRIEKKVILHADRKRVWQAISDSKEFGSWFGMKIEGPFTPGKTVLASIATSAVDPDSAKVAAEFSGLIFPIMVEEVEAERLFTFRWHPHAIERGKDYASEPTTLVTFKLTDVPGGTELTVTESGFDGIPLDRREKAFTSNTHGWEAQLLRIGKYLSRSG